MRARFYSSAIALALSTVACSGVDTGSVEPTPVDEEALATGGNTAKKTVVVTEKDGAGNAAELSFFFATANGKRVARMSAVRGAAKTELDCSQVTNLGTKVSADEIVTLCEEQIRPGYEYVSVYVRFHPAAKTFSYDVIAAHPTNLTQHQRELYTLFTGQIVTTPPLAHPEPSMSHDARLLDLPAKAKSIGTDPFGDPIALTASIHDGLRGPIGEQAYDPGSALHADSFVVQAVSAFTDFDSLVYTFQAGGRANDKLYHQVYGLKVLAATSNRTLATNDAIASAMKAALPKPPP